MTNKYLEKIAATVGIKQIQAMGSVSGLNPKALAGLSSLKVGPSMGQIALRGAVGGLAGGAAVYGVGKLRNSLKDSA